ncbi:hypothetical protein Halru_1616 [Halovivax ruber XH-70]|uniref:Glycosyltransferase RgtA/B/C/D-like domain-containing protein n=1 Tax=Halovivax ruber (strain DSM 18193 / JCM 13892 / XH-70) TaxID=797302 RepID=L0IBM5_HALRX|nr:hypothetical protein [Halovivax ruber]AGB16223.1 hypothetical protein Halru_1616 [Halovivax ruber XH-70]
MRKTLANGWIAVGFVAVAIAIVAGRLQPATGYEPSLYAATPALTWLCLGLAFVVAVPTALTHRGIHQALGIGLGGLAVTTIVCLPLIRGYTFIGMGDGLTHLGWTRDIQTGAMAPHDLFYPGLHSLATGLSTVGGFDLSHALLIAVVVLFVPFVLFVPLTVDAITDRPQAVGVAAILSWFVLPVNNVATHMGAHSNTNALFLVPVFLFAVVAYLYRRAPVSLPVLGSPYGVLVVFVGLGLLLVHPQQLASAVVVLASIAAIQLLVRRRSSDDQPILEHPTTTAHTAVLVGAFSVWVLVNERFRDAVIGLAYGLATTDIGGDEAVGQRRASLTEIGGSIPELFAKLFLVSALVGLVVGGYLLIVWLGRSHARPRTRTAATYLGGALVPLGAMFAVYFLGTPTMAFRQVGFIAVVLTILGAVAISGFVGWSGQYVPRGLSTGLVAIVLGACLVLALATVFASPFIYSPTQHVSEGTYHGYETAITNGTDQPYAGYGYTTYRFNHALYGVEGVPPERAGIVGSGTGVIDADEFNDEDYQYAYADEDPYFLAVSSFDTVREHDLYRGLNYDPGAYERLESYDGSSRYVSNGEFVLYEVASGSDRFR